MTKYARQLFIKFAILLCVVLLCYNTNKYTSQNISGRKLDQTCTPLIIVFCVPHMKSNLQTPLL